MYFDIFFPGQDFLIVTEWDIRSDMARDPGVPGKLFSGSQKGPFLCFQIHISMFLIVSRLNMEYESSVLVLILNCLRFSAQEIASKGWIEVLWTSFRDALQCRTKPGPYRRPTSQTRLNSGETHGGNGGFQGNSETVMFDSPRPSAKQLAADPFLKTQALQSKSPNATIISRFHEPIASGDQRKAEFQEFRSPKKTFASWVLGWGAAGTSQCLHSCWQRWFWNGWYAGQLGAGFCDDRCSNEQLLLYYKECIEWNRQYEKCIGRIAGSQFWGTSGLFAEPWDQPERRAGWGVVRPLRPRRGGRVFRALVLFSFNSHQLKTWDDPKGLSGSVLRTEKNPKRLNFSRAFATLRGWDHQQVRVSGGLQCLHYRSDHLQPGRYQKATAGGPHGTPPHTTHKFWPQKVPVFWVFWGARAKVISEIVQNVEKFTQSSQLKKANLDEFLSFFVKSFLPTVGWCWLMLIISKI